jgi:acetyl-CoA C-acetyltransferase
LVEEAYDLFMPQFMYPFFETVLRSISGRTPEEHRFSMGRSYERLSRIASQNPYAWGRQVFSAEDITLTTPRNRPVVYPYTFRMVANINVDQSAALIIWYVTQRPQLHDSPAIDERS